MGEKSIEVVFIPYPVRSHLVALMQLAKLLIDKTQYLSITFITLKLPTDTKVDSFIENLIHPSMKFVQIPYDQPSWETLQRTRKRFLAQYLEGRKAEVRDALADLAADPTRVIAGIVLDMFSTAMVDLADEFRVPSYVCFASSAAALGLMLHFQRLYDEFGQGNETQYEDLDSEFEVPTFANPVPLGVLPSPVLDRDNEFFNHMRNYRRCKGIVINSFLELETQGVKSLLADGDVPKVYPVGPMIHYADVEELGVVKGIGREEILKWLDHQPESSVIYLCFGSNGTLPSHQVKEIATALENSGHRFLWSLRKPAPEGKFQFAGEYENPEEVLPDGFLQRTAGIGKVIGWAPQVAVLSHPSVGGFVSHCGWNSSLESVWCGVPVAVWPLSAEQQTNAFQFVKEFGMAVDIKMDYRKENGVIVGAEKIERALKELMDPENEIRSKVNAMRDKSRVALKENGSSHDFLGQLVEDIINGVS